MSTDASPSEPLASPPQVAARLGNKPQTLAQWRWKKIGPPWMKIGGRIRYQWSDVEAWLAEQRVRSQ